MFFLSLSSVFFVPELYFKEPCQLFYGSYKRGSDSLRHGEPEEVSLDLQ